MTQGNSSPLSVAFQVPTYGDLPVGTSIEAHALAWVEASDGLHPLGLYIANWRAAGSDWSIRWDYASGGSVSSSAELLVALRQSSSAMSGLSVVKDTGDGIHCEVASSSSLASASAVLGVVVASVAAPGVQCLIVRSGQVSDAAWAWSQGTVWLSASGTFTQTPPSSGVLLPLGQAVSPTSIMVSIGSPIIRS